MRSPHALSGIGSTGDGNGDGDTRYEHDEFREAAADGGLLEIVNHLDM